MNEKCLYVFEPIKLGFDSWLWIPIMIMTFCIIAGVVAQKKITDKNRRLTLLMVISFAGTISFFTSLSRTYAIWRTQPVKLYTEHLETPFGKTTYFNIKDYFIRLQHEYKPMQPETVRDSTRYLMIIERNDKTHLLSQSDYPIDTILAKMNEVINN